MRTTAIIVATAAISALVSLFAVVGIAVLVSPSPPQTVVQTDAPDRDRTWNRGEYEQSLAGFRDYEIWREFYDVGTIDSRSFCMKGDIRYSQQNVYRRIPRYERFSPYQESLYGKFGEQVPLPKDGGYFHVTLVYLDKETDPASKHLANAFMQPEHWLNHLRHHSHFRTVSHGDELYRNWIVPNWGLRKQDLPAVVVTEPIDKKRRELNQHGRIVYFAPARDAPWHPDRLAYEIWAQMRKGPYASEPTPTQQPSPNRVKLYDAAYRPQQQTAQAVNDRRQAEQCDPDNCWPDRDRDRDWLPDRGRKPLLPPSLRPTVNVGFGGVGPLLIGALVLIGLVVIVVVVVIAAVVIFRR